MKTKAAVCRAFGAPLTVETVELAEPGARRDADKDGGLRDLP